MCTLILDSGSTVDANWRWCDNEQDGQVGPNCYLGNSWDDSACPNTEEGGLTCAKNCALEGADDE